jgi:Holliday junction resolvase-like predicted endonuclease
LALNWKTRFCEIDIVAQKHKKICFIEVKQRKNNLQGYGHDYVTTQKLAKMRLAAEMWIHEHHWQGPYELSVISIDAGNITFFESIDI